MTPRRIPFLGPARLILGILLSGLVLLGACSTPEERMAQARRLYAHRITQDHARVAELLAQNKRFHAIKLVDELVDDYPGDCVYPLIRTEAIIYYHHYDFKKTGRAETFFSAFEVLDAQVERAFQCAALSDFRDFMEAKITELNSGLVTLYESELILAEERRHPSQNLP